MSKEKGYNIYRYVYFSPMLNICVWSVSITPVWARTFNNVRYNIPVMHWKVRVIYICSCISSHWNPVGLFWYRISKLSGYNVSLMVLNCITIWKLLHLIVSYWKFKKKIESTYEEFRASDPKLLNIMYSLMYSNVPPTNCFELRVTYRNRNNSWFSNHHLSNVATPKH